MPSCGPWSNAWAATSSPPLFPKVLSNVTINITDTRMSENAKRPVHEARPSTRRRHRPDLQDSLRPRARVVEGAVVASAEVRLHAAAAFSRFGGHLARQRSQTSFVFLPLTDDCVRTAALRVSGQRPSMKGSQTLSLFFPMANLHRQPREGSPLNSRWKRVNCDHKPGHVSDDRTGIAGRNVEKNTDMNTHNNKARNRTTGQYYVVVFATVCHT